jgi:hypothetical protein
MNTLKIQSEDIYNIWVRQWMTIHTIIINDEFIGKSNNARDVLDDNEVDINNLKVDDDHTKSVLDGTYKSEWIQERNSYNN